MQVQVRHIISLTAQLVSDEQYIVMQVPGRHNLSLTTQSFVDGTVF